MDRSVYQVYEDEIQLLEAEIKLLSEKYEDIQQESTFFSDEEVQMSVYVFCLYWIIDIYQNSFTYAFVCVLQHWDLYLFLQRCCDTDLV